MTKSKFKKLDRVCLSVFVPGPHQIGEPLTVASVINQGTKRNPKWRYAVSGAFYDEDVLEACGG